MDKNRVMAFTDAIIAIAATIMVLKMKVPDVGLSMTNLLELLPIFFAYTVSFFFDLFCMEIPS